MYDSVKQVGGHMMSKSIESTLTSIDEQINALKKKKKEELAKMEQKVGKKFIATFDLSDQSINDIFSMIEKLNKKEETPDQIKKSE